MQSKGRADLEADSEGVPLEDVLGSGAYDPRSFAAAWAHERGVGRRSSSSLRRALLFATFAAFVAVAISGTALTVFASPSQSVRAAGPSTLSLRPAPAPPATAVTAVWVTAAPVAEAATDDDTRTLGRVLLIVGLAGTAALSLFSLWRRSTAL